MKYKVEAEILTVVSCFENGSIPRENWKHAEHLTVALYYILNSKSLSDACDKMRGGIFNLLKSFQIDLSKDMPYHETLTVFWIRTIADFTKSENDASIVEICNALIENFDKDYPLKFYSRETKIL